MLWARSIGRPLSRPNPVYTSLHRHDPSLSVCPLWLNPFTQPTPAHSRMSGTRRGGETIEERVARKAAVKADKAHRRAAREGRLGAVDPDYGKKPCDLCDTLVDVLIRCQIDESGRWYMVCGGTCWRKVSGGVVDGDEQHPHYRYESIRVLFRFCMFKPVFTTTRYGGLWKNLHAAAK